MPIFRLFYSLLLALPLISAANTGSFAEQAPTKGTPGVSWRIDATWDAQELEVTFMSDVADQKINGWTSLGGRWHLAQLGGFTAHDPFSLAIHFKASFVDTSTGELIDPTVLGYSNVYSPDWRLAWFSGGGTTTSLLNASGVLSQSLVITDERGIDTGGALGACFDPGNCPGKTASQTFDYAMTFAPGDGGAAHLQDVNLGFTVVAGVPEPATWASLFAGLAIIGLMVWRRRA